MALNHRRLRAAIQTDSSRFGIIDTVDNDSGRHTINESTRNSSYCASTAATIILNTVTITTIRARVCSDDRVIPKGSGVAKCRGTGSHAHIHDVTINILTTTATAVLLVPSSYHTATTAPRALSLIRRIAVHNNGPVYSLNLSARPSVRHTPETR